MQHTPNTDPGVPGDKLVAYVDANTNHAGCLDDPFDSYNHGTLVAGAMAGSGRGVLHNHIAYTENSIDFPYAGIAPGANIRSYNIYDRNITHLPAPKDPLNLHPCWVYPFFDSVGVLSALNQDWNAGAADVVNMSLASFGSPNDPISMAADMAFDHGQAVIASSGNVNTDPNDPPIVLQGTSIAPANARKVLAVGAVGSGSGSPRGEVTAYSIFGETIHSKHKPELVAPSDLFLPTSRINKANPWFNFPTIIGVLAERVSPHRSCRAPLSSGRRSSNLSYRATIPGRPTPSFMQQRTGPPSTDPMAGPPMTLHRLLDL